MVAPLLLPLAGLLGGLFMQNREARANQARLLANRNIQTQAFSNLRNLADPSKVMTTTPDRLNPNINIKTMVGGQPGVLENIPSVLTAQRRDPVESGLLRTRMLGQEAAKERGETVSPDMTPGPGLLAKELRPTAASMPFRFNEDQMNLLEAQALMDIPDANIRKETGSALVKNILGGADRDVKSTFAQVLLDSGLTQDSPEFIKLMRQQTSRPGFDDVLKLTNAVKPTRKQYNLVKDRVAQVITILDQAKPGRGLSAVTLVNSFQRLIDPAVVRKEDVELQTESQGIARYLANKLKSLGVQVEEDGGIDFDSEEISNVIFDEAALNEFRVLTNDFMNVAKKSYTQDIAQYIPAATDQGISVDKFAPEYNKLIKQIEKFETQNIPVDNLNTNAAPGPNIQNQNTSNENAYVIGADGLIYNKATGERLK